MASPKSKSSKSKSSNGSNGSSGTGSTTSHLIDKSLFLVRQEIPIVSAKVAPTPANVNHIVVIDCSGSMTGDLPQIRDQLKNKLPKMMREGDTVSIVWFSGKGEFGALLEAEPIPTLKDLKQVQAAIDRWLKPVGLTGFKEPLEEVSKLVDRVSKKTAKDSVFSLFFMSDGCDNQWPRPSILAAVEKAAGKLAASAFVEYGYYADRQLLASMAEKAGGQHIFAEDFNSYTPKFEKVLQMQVVGSGKRIEVNIEGDPILGIAWTMTPDSDLLTFEVTGDKILVPEGTKSIAYLSPKLVGDSGQSVNGVAMDFWKTKKEVPGLADAYAALSLLAVRMKPEIVYPILKSLGDVNFIHNFGKCFGKQKYSEFMDWTKAAAFATPHRFVNGYDPTAVPDDDAFTVLDLLRVLTEDDNVRVMLDSPHFTYSRISRARVDADQGGDALKFVATGSPDEGYPISSLTYNEDRPNISMLVKKLGTVDLTRAMPDQFKGKLPMTMNTFIFRNYAIVKDGLVNIAQLPLKLPETVKATLQKNGVKMSDVGQGITLVEVSPLPIINRSMVKAASAKTLLELEYELTKQRAFQKVWNAYRNELAPKVSTGGFATVYGDDAALWLKEQGLTDYSGFGPKKATVESTDFYIGKEMSVSLKGYGSLPKVDDIKTKKKAPTGGGVFMNEAVDEAEGFFKKNPEKLHVKWVSAKADVVTATTRGLIHQMAKQKFAVIVGQTWFVEAKSLDDNTFTVKQDGKDIVGTIKLAEIEIKI